MVTKYASSSRTTTGLTQRVATRSPATLSLHPGLLEVPQQARQAEGCEDMAMQTHLTNFLHAMEHEGRDMSLADVYSVMTTLRSSLIELQFLANTFSPINRVPVELLVMIFTHVTESDRDSFVYRFVINDLPKCQAYTEARGAVRLTHICRHWRRVALNSPNLWTRIDGRRPERLELFLKRAQTLPVSLFLNVDEAELTGLLGIVPIEQLRRLDLCLEDERIDPLTTWCAPNLECLTVDMEQDLWVPAPTVPSLARIRLLAGHADALKALALQPLCHWLPSNAFPSLTHLHLSFAYNTDAVTHDLLSVLANVPNLEFLYIGGHLCEEDDVASLSARVVLSRLKSLTVVDTPYTCTMALLRQLSLPEHCFMRFHDIIIDPEEEGEPGPLVDVGPLRHATRLDLASTEGEFFLIAESDRSGFWMWAHFEDGLSTLDSWFHGLPAMITLSTITSLHINISATYTFWSTVLTHMTAVTELKIIIGRTLEHSCPADTFCALMSQEPVLLPALRDVYVQRVYSEDSITTLTPGLVDAVAFRARSGHRLRRLVVQSDANASLPFNPFGSRTAELAALVDEFELVGSGPELCEFKVRDIWHVDGAERYWRLDEYWRPHSTAFDRALRSSCL